MKRGNGYNLSCAVAFTAASGSIQRSFLSFVYRDNYWTVFTLRFIASVGSGNLAKFVSAPLFSMRSDLVRLNVHVIVLGECHLKRVLSSYADYYQTVRTHLSLKKDAPDGRPIQRSERGRVVELKRVGGLHHEYVRMAA